MSITSFAFLSISSLLLLIFTLYLLEVSGLHIAANKGYFELVQLLVKAGASLMAVTNGGSTAIDFASSKGHHDIVNFLSQEGGILFSTFISDTYDTISYV